MTTEDGKPHPDVQICIMNARCIALVAQERERWPLADDNLFIDIDLRPDNLPPRQPAAPTTCRPSSASRSERP